MFHIHDVLLPKEGEVVHCLVRRHGVTLVPQLLLAGLLMVVPFFLLFPLARWGAIGTVLFVLLLASGLFVALRAFLLWDADVLIVTSERVVDVDQRGLWNRIVCETPLIFIQEVICEQKGLADAVCRMGTVRIRSAPSATAEMSASCVRRPERLRQMIQDLRSRKS